ncbi:MAG: DUF2997 domain-containing protein [Pirellulales bacterium]
MKMIEVMVTASGETRIETKGFTGSECRDASSQLEQALGIARSDQPTAEMYAELTAGESVPLGASRGGSAS